MTISEALQAVAKKATQLLKSSKVTATNAATPKIVEKINSTFSAEKVASTAGKIVGALATANITDSLVQKVPVANNIYNWYVGVIDDMYESTVRKIPGFGDILRKLSDFINKLVIPNAQRAIEEHRNANNPRWYLSDQARTEFSISYNYSDDRQYPYSVDIRSNNVSVVKIGFNALAAVQKQANRYTQLITLLKGVRGLSFVSYGEGDVCLYEWMVDYLINEYYRLKFALRLANYYEYEKARMPKNLLTNLGWSANDFILNIANYKEILVNIYNIIVQTYPKFGLIPERLKCFWNGLYPDSNDGVVATYYAYDVNITTIIPDRLTDTYMPYGPHFTQHSAVAPGSQNLGMTDTTSGLVTYAVYSAAFNTFQDALGKLPKSFKDLIGDIDGAIGSSARWNDESINDVNLTGKKAVDNMLKPFDELFMTQLQNATLVQSKGVDIYGSSSVMTDVASPILMFTYPNFAADHSIDTMPTVGNSDYAPIHVEARGNNATSTPGTMILPSSDGLVGLTTAGDVTRDDTIVIANKHKMTEGEDLEIIQLLAFYISSTSGKTATYDYIASEYETNVFFAKRIDVLWYNEQFNTDSVTSLTGRAVATGTSVSYGSIAAQLQEDQFWSQADYGPKLPRLVFNSSSAAILNSLLLDFNIMGSISREQYKNARKRAVDAQYAANFKIGDKSNRVSNVIGVYRIAS